MFLKTAVAINMLTLSMLTNAAITTEVICTYAPSQSTTINRILNTTGGVARGARITLFANGLKIVQHSSGAAILAGSDGYIAGTMPGALLTSTLITASVIIGSAAFTVELACAPINHPDSVKAVRDGAKEYSAQAGEIINNASIQTSEISKRKSEELTELIKRYKTFSKDKLYEVMGETWYEKAVRKTKEISGL